jgi:predicted PurR-regulated permease PerM
MRAVNAVRTPPVPWDVTRVLLAVLALGGLIVASLWVLRPFLPALIWATMIVVATWPAMRAAQRRLGNRRGLAVALMTVAMLLIVIVPIAVAIVVVVEHADEAVEWSKSVIVQAATGPPAWVAGLPVVGAKVSSEWQKLASGQPEDVASQIGPYVRAVGAWIVFKAGSLGLLLVQLLLTVVVAAILYSHGETVAAGARAFARRLAGDAGDQVVVLSGQAIRAVALGIVVTALVQSVIGGIGLAITGVPYPVLLTAVMFLLAVAQIGAGPVLLGAVVWLYWKDQTLWAAVLLIWSLITASLDNVLRPILIKRGADLPLVLIFAGVLGGLVAFGIVGLFVGPVVLAVTYTLLVAWVNQATEPGQMTAGAGGPDRAHPVRVSDVTTE